MSCGGCMRRLRERVLERTAELAQANQNVQQERDQLQILMDNIPDTIYFKDAASRFTRINPAQARTLGVWDPQQRHRQDGCRFLSARGSCQRRTQRNNTCSRPASRS